MKIIFLLLAICHLPIGYGDGQVLEEPEFPEQKFDIVCNLNAEVCNTECYDPSTHRCLATKDGAIHTICPLDQTLCGSRCWSASSGKICTPVDDEGLLENICDPGQLSCSWNCYNPAEKDCSDNWLCPKGQISCGIQCYSPADPVKCHRSAGRNSVCKLGEEACGGWGCYNPQRETCSENQDSLCIKGHQFCGSDCYNATAGDTCHNGTYGQVACKAHEEFCGSSCYDPKEGKICANNALVCNPGETNCGDQGCYAPDSGARCFDTKANHHVICDKGQDYCDFKCFEPKTQACLIVEGENFKKVCPIGHQICNGKLDPYTWGYACYDPATSTCLKDDQNSYVLCKKGESLCGTICYKPANDGLMCRDNAAICKPDQEVCGNQCYDPATKKCFRNVVSDTQWA